MTSDGDSKRHTGLLIAGITVILLAASCNSNQPDTVTNTRADTIAVVQADSVKPAAIPVEDSSRKKIYLTFDDGPNPGTPAVLNILEQEQVPATFFLIGEHRYYGPEEQRDWDRLQASKQLELCNHSYTHAWRNRFDKFYAHPERVINDFKRCEDSLHFKNRVSRTPGRNMWRLAGINYSDNRKSKAAVDSLSKAGYIMMGWDVEWQYYGKTQALRTDADYMLRLIDSLFKNNKTRTTNHLVLLAHDRVYADAADSTQLSYFIQELKKHPEYEFRVASTYPGVQ